MFTFLGLPFSVALPRGCGSGKMDCPRLLKPPSSNALPSLLDGLGHHRASRVAFSQSRVWPSGCLAFSHQLLVIVENCYLRVLFNLGPPQRPKLNLKPRSTPKEDDSSASTSQSSRAASIFGGAKPVDTAAREREVEERLQKEQEKLQRQLDEPKLERRPRER